MKAELILYTQANSNAFYIINHLWFTDSCVEVGLHMALPVQASLLSALYTFLVFIVSKVKVLAP